MERTIRTRGGEHHERNQRRPATSHRRSSSENAVWGKDRAVDAVISGMDQLSARESTDESCASQYAIGLICVVTLPDDPTLDRRAEHPPFCCASRCAPCFVARTLRGLLRRSRPISRRALAEEDDLAPVISTLSAGGSPPHPPARSRRAQPPDAGGVSPIQALEQSRLVGHPDLEFLFFRLDAIDLSAG